jgi:hypothetical protein
MISGGWCVVAFIGGTWAGFFVAALMRMSADRRDPAPYTLDLVRPRAQPRGCGQAPWHWGPHAIVQRERSGP